MRRGLVVVVSLLVLAGCGWTQHSGGPGMTGSVATESQLTEPRVATLHTVWSVPFVGQCCVTEGLEPVSDGSAVYTVVPPPRLPPAPDPYFGYLSAFDLTTGSRRWATQADDIDLQRTPAVGGGLVVAAGRCGQNSCVYAFHSADGTLAWTHNNFSLQIMTSPTISNGVVYVEDRLETLDLDLTTGVVSGGRPRSYDPFQTTASNGRFINGDGTAFDQSTGRPIWGGLNRGVHPIDGDDVFTVDVFPYGGGSYLRNRDAATGHITWSTPVACSGATPSVSSNRVVVECARLFGFDRATGVDRWSFTPQGTTTFQPTLANGLVFFANGAAITVLRASDGSHIRTIDFSSSNPVGTPVVSNGHVLVLGASGLTALAA